MQRETRKRWMELCEQAAVEQDRDRPMDLVSEIERLLTENEQRLRETQLVREAPKD